MKVTYESREGRITVLSWRVIVTVGTRSAAGPWCFTKRDARTHIEDVRRSLFNAEEAERQLDANSRDRCARIQQRLETDRRVRFPDVA